MSKQITIINQKPVQFNLENMNVIVNPNDTADDFLKAIETKMKTEVVNPLFTPLNPSNTTEISTTDGNNTVLYDEETIYQAIRSLIGNTCVDPNLDNELKELYQKSMRYTTANMYPFSQQFIVQLFAKYKLPMPSSNVIYTPKTDLIPSAKDVLVDWTDVAYKENFLASLGGMIMNMPISNRAKIVVCHTNNEYSHIQNAITGHMTNPNVSSDVSKILNDVQNLKMTASQISTAWIMPGVGTSAPYEPNSFNRIVDYEIANAKSTSNVMQPVYDLKTIELPQIVVFLNVEAISHATSKEIAKEFNDINNTLKGLSKVMLMSFKKISTLSAVRQNMGSGNRGSVNVKGGSVANRLAMIPLKGKAYTNVQQIKLMMKVAKMRTTSIQSENRYKTVKQTYMRPNRREPNSINLKGKMNMYKYRPDIHIYLDTSGSITEKQYKVAIKNLILLAKKLQVNIYFNSFSHIVSQTKKLQTANKSVKQLYMEFMKIPKVTGRTDFLNVWNMIDNEDVKNKMHHKAEHINFIISDMEDNVPSDYRFNAQGSTVLNTYYVPISVSSQQYPIIKQYAEKLMEQMKIAGHVNARKHFLM